MIGSRAIFLVKLIPFTLSKESTGRENYHIVRTQDLTKKYFMVNINRDLC